MYTRGVKPCVKVLYCTEDPDEVEADTFESESREEELLAGKRDDPHDLCMRCLVLCDF